MYFPIGWPKVLNIQNRKNCSIRQLICNRDKILFAVLTDDTLLIYYCKVSLESDEQQCLSSLLCKLNT